MKKWDLPWVGLAGASLLFVGVVAAALYDHPENLRWADHAKPAQAAPTVVVAAEPKPVIDHANLFKEFQAYRQQHQGRIN